METWLGGCLVTDWSDWHMPIAFALELPVEVPECFALLYGPALLLAACLGFDRARQSAGPTDPGIPVASTPSSASVPPKEVPPEGKGLDAGILPA
jgi:hypothetical protein